MAERLYTLTEVAQLTDISMPTLQRYKKLFQERIPSRGSGRTQRYTEEALEVFRELKKENMKKRGRPRKNANADAKPAVRRRPVPQSSISVTAEDEKGLLTLKQVEELTNISYPTLLRYVKTSLKRIPHKGTGRKRRFLPEAVDVFKTLREESRRGRKAPTKVTGAATTTIRPRPSGAIVAPPGTAAPGAVATVTPATAPAKASPEVAELYQMVRELQKSHGQLQREVARLEKELNKPFKVVLKRGT